MPNSQTPNSRAARARCATAANQRKLAEGWQRLNIMISPAAAAALERLVAVHGTKTAAVEVALTGALQMNLTKKQIAAFMAARHPGMKHFSAADSWVGDGHGIDDADARAEALAEIELWEDGTIEKPAWYEG